MRNKGTVAINFTIGFGNNLFQYVFGRLLAEKNGLDLNHEPIPELGVKKQDNKADGSLPTVIVNDSNYKQALNANLNGYNVIINGYFEDYTLFGSHLEKIRSWFTKVEKTNTDDIILHLRLQNRLIQESHNKNHISAASIKEVLQSVEYNNLHIVTDAEKWETYGIEDIEKIQYQVKTGPNPNPAWVSAEQSLEYINHLISGLAELNPTVHCNGKEMMPGTGGLRGGFIDDFNLIRTFDKVLVHNSTFSWWAATLSGASKVGVFNPWKIAKPPGLRRNLGETNYDGWFSWGSAQSLYFKKYGIKK